MIFKNIFSLFCLFLLLTLFIILEFYKIYVLGRNLIKIVNKMVKKVNLRMVNNYIVIIVCIGWLIVIDLIYKVEVNVNKGLRLLLF